VGGPGPEESQPPGTVWWAVHSPAGTQAGCDRFGGDPADVVAATIELSLQRILAALDDAA
jgi:nicotinamide-nucleotide amidase